MISTGNEWIALPTIRAADAALQNFNVLSMRDRGLLQVNGAGGGPAVAPRVMIDGTPVQFANLSWELLDYWIPRAHLSRGSSRDYDHVLRAAGLARRLRGNRAHQ